MQHLLHQIKAQQFYSDLDLYQQCQFLQKIEEFKDFSRPLYFPVHFKAYLIFKAFQGSPLYSSTFQACANPVVPVEEAGGLNLLIESMKINSLPKLRNDISHIKSFACVGKQ